MKIIKKIIQKDIRAEELRKFAKLFANKNLDDFWKKYIDGTEDLPLGEYLNECGLKLLNENEKSKSSLNIETGTENGRYIITKVVAGGSAYESGLNTGDEIIALNGIRVDSKLSEDLLKDFSVDDRIAVLISRKGLIKEMDVVLKSPLPKFKIEEQEEKTDKQKKMLDKWMVG